MKYFPIQNLECLLLLYCKVITNKITLSKYLLNTSPTNITNKPNQVAYIERGKLFVDDKGVVQEGIKVDLDELFS